MNAVDFLDLFDYSTSVVLLDPRDNEVYSGDVRRCRDWLMKNSQYDIFPDAGGTWAYIDNDALVVLLDEYVD